MTTKALYRSAVAYLALGLGAGLYYRTLTHSQDFDGTTVLGLAHTHVDGHDKLPGDGHEAARWRT